MSRVLDSEGAVSQLVYPTGTRGEDGGGRGRVHRGGGGGVRGVAGGGQGAYARGRYEAAG